MGKKIVFYGGGNMTEGIVRGLLDRGVSSPKDITISEILPERCTYLSKTYGVAAVADVSNSVKEAYMVIVSVGA